MKVKKFVAPSMPEAMKKIRAELGNDAVILNSKMVQTGGFLGFFKKKNLEVIAAIDPKPKVEPKPVVKEKVKKMPTTASRQEFDEVEAPPSTEKRTGVVQKDKSTDDLMKEINELKMLIKGIPSAQEGHKAYNFPEPIQSVQRLLDEQEVNKNLQDKWLSKLIEKWYIAGARSDEKNIQQWLKELIDSEMESIQFGGISFVKKYVNVVGPTGVGKTTTLAKIAAECVIKHKKKVAFITTDTYRIAAIEQLKTYASILNIPIEVCYNLEDFKKAKEAFSDYDIVLIDTAGRNFRNQQYVEDLKKIIDFKSDMQTFLVLSLTSKQRDMMEIYKQFSLITIDQFIFTKTDETESYGAILNMITQYNKGVAYLTNGQNVPDDMIPASPKVLTNLLLGVETHE
ncbi:flagellar biosynthesis protein FlhF [Cytobacillus spongiae]|uniref:flagellar biosynthesis protein FlhF n=1 Tax=Cytobacillus spongiae TaxID=2901381 RepID=UPI001F2D8AD1|nr:flagellar biosynthesis protein FlhF [Cytobacillus spongiae]UII57428.1 flagellar biosynthesis protein FlhF [Cytobacillus spongiae]